PAERADVHTLVIPRGAKTVTLILHSASPAVYPTYRLEIVDARDRAVWQGEGLVRQPTGEYTISLPTELLPAGRYAFHVYAPGRDQRPRVESYGVRIVTRP